MKKKGEFPFLIYEYSNSFWYLFIVIISAIFGSEGLNSRLTLDVEPKIKH